MKPLNVYACYNLNKSVRLSSSSGAVFSSLAELVLEQQGVVYGVAMSDDCYSAEFISVISKDDLKKLRGSKYLQAKVGDTYKSVKSDLLSGKMVLFSGTGCQVNGLKCFLGKEYDNLLCVDVICHGAPSPALWREYVKYQEQKFGMKLIDINFRCKDKSWTDSGMLVVGKDVSNEEIKKYIPKDMDPYMQMFLRDFCLRPSCYQCIAKKVKMSDLTIADFWGVDNVVSDMNDDKGTSLVIVRTARGKDIFLRISDRMKWKEVSYEQAVRANPAEYRSCDKPIQRQFFFNDMYSMSFEELEKKYAAPIKVRLLTRVKKIIKTIIKRW